MRGPTIYEGLARERDYFCPCFRSNADTGVKTHRFQSRLLVYTIYGLTDESVRLSYDEFKEKYIEDVMKGGSWKPMFEAAFSYMDLNDDGVMSFDEWKALYTCVGIDLAYARPSFDAMDANSDGVVSKEEFMNFVYEFYCTGETSWEAPSCMNHLIELG